MSRNNIVISGCIIEGQMSCIYNDVNNATLLYGQYISKINSKRVLLISRSITAIDIIQQRHEHLTPSVAITANISVSAFSSQHVGRAASTQVLGTDGPPSCVGGLNSSQHR